METRFCQFCGNQVDTEVVVCPKCGRQIKELKVEAASPQQPQTVISNTNTVTTMGGKKCDKWVAFLLCFFFGCIGVHKFYEGKVGMGILYILTVGLFGIGVLIDLIVILCKPNPYYV